MTRDEAYRLEGHPVWEAIDRGGGQTCNIAGVICALFDAGYVIVPKSLFPNAEWPGGGTGAGGLAGPGGRSAHPSEYVEVKK